MIVKKLLLLLITLILLLTVSFNSFASDDMPVHASYTDERTETEYISYLVDEDFIEQAKEFGEEEGATTIYSMSNKKDNEFIDIDYTEREKQILNNYYDKNLTLEDLVLQRKTIGTKVLKGNYLEK